MAIAVKINPKKIIPRIVALGAVAAVAWIFRDFIVEAAIQAINIGWGFFLLPLLFMGWSIPAVLGWRSFLLVTPRQSIPDMWRLLVIRFESLAVSFTVPSAGFGGDVLRTLLTREQQGGHSSAPPVVLDRIAFAGAETIVAFLGLTFYASRATNGVVKLTASFLGIVAFLFLIVMWRPVITVIAKIPWAQKNAAVRKSMATLLEIKAYRRAFFRSWGWHLFERILMVGEIWLTAWLIGVRIGPVESLFSSAMATLFSVALFCFPAQLGAYEGGLVFAFSALGEPAIAGLSIALIRRARQLLVIGTGFLFLLFERSDKSQNSG
ncbi:MAG: hypothetical protein GF401_13420 [Chitinivibrionales bacterium]|nr:hypothetical protein [Chitinivibrionales bacterium]